LENMFPEHPAGNIKGHFPPETGHPLAICSTSIFVDNLLHYV
jgi:hypothetical protein